MRAVVTTALILLGAISCTPERPDASAVYVRLNEPAPADLAKLQWLTGYWTGDHDGTRMDEVWLPRRGDVMVGVHLDHFPSGRTFFEYLRIEQEGNSVIFMASPRGRPATSFIATSVSDSSVTFENSQHDYPQKIGYRLDRAGRLHARISGEVDGAEESTEWVWTAGDLPRP